MLFIPLFAIHALFLLSSCFSFILPSFYVSLFALFLPSIFLFLFLHSLVLFHYPPAFVLFVVHTFSLLLVSRYKRRVVIRLPLFHTGCFFTPSTFQINDRFFAFESHTFLGISPILLFQSRQEIYTWNEAVRVIDLPGGWKSFWFIRILGRFFRGSTGAIRRLHPFLAAMIKYTMLTVYVVYRQVGLLRD